MSAPSTTSYFPFDSDAPSVFSATQKGNYLIGEWIHAISSFHHHLMLALKPDPLYGVPLMKISS
jgi:hypothetical protein